MDILDTLYRLESRQILATLIRLLGDFDQAEEAMHEGFRAALEKWPSQGVPNNPRAWLISTARFKAIDRLRRTHREFSSDILPEPTPRENDPTDAPDSLEAIDTPSEIADDRLRLLFICCHPALPMESRVALTLREVCGLTTEEIARAFLSTPSALAQRIVRAKSKIKEDRLPYEVPSAAELPERLSAVQQAIYLVFNEGYSASAGNDLTRPDLSAEAIRLGRLLVELLPDSDAQGLLALMLLIDARRLARSSPEGDLILLDDQDRTRWDEKKIEEGLYWVAQAQSSGRLGSYTIQAAINAVHVQGPTPSATDWKQIVLLYDLLLRVEPSPIVELNRAVAVALHDGPSAGLALVDDLLARGELETYYFMHCVRADLFRRLGKKTEARAAYEQALRLTEQTPQRRFIEKRLFELD